MSRDRGSMYRWRQMTSDQRAEVLADRIAHDLPVHSLAHFENNSTSYYLITAACYEHKHIIGRSPARIQAFERELVQLLDDECHQVFAWTVLPNHYHALVDAPSILDVLQSLGKLHGRNSFFWNGEEGARGRKVWCNAAETAMKSQGHYYASMNYVLHNAVHHGYVDKWTDWPYCSATEYLERIGREKALQIWNRYPIYDFGKDWDPADL
ncbi:transposase [Novipirellula artificiosorum]|uniref:Transposase IS200-like domain-containing protein n=1 Tax=Novipirellula artificiosorum TaxID=2528016 RepID=A0A5C6DWK8_9BACT|nr:transposase [Novipirellula artificiosorum]TWU41002.1 hypothetical protein Poly41_18370 [Novipirellula artificiosorum]